MKISFNIMFEKLSSYFGSHPSSTTCRFTLIIFLVTHTEICLYRGGQRKKLMLAIKSRLHGEEDAQISARFSKGGRSRITNSAER